MIDRWERAIAKNAPRLHRAAQPDGRLREVSVRQLADEACLHHVEQHVVHAAVGGVSVGEIALLQGKPP
jgi:hypothetical protein